MTLTSESNIHVTSNDESYIVNNYVNNSSENEDFWSFNWQKKWQ